MANPLDYEHTPRYFLTIEARDGGTPPLSVTTVATINVIDINDNPPYFIGQDASPISLNDTITSTQDPDVGVFSFEVYENSPVGTQIGRVSKFLSRIPLSFFYFSLLSIWTAFDELRLGSSIFST